jgi:hypothetical protein
MGDVEHGARRAVLGVPGATVASRRGCEGQARDQRAISPKVRVSRPCATEKRQSSHLAQVPVTRYDFWHTRMPVQVDWIPSNPVFYQPVFGIRREGIRGTRSPGQRLPGGLRHWEGRRTSRPRRSPPCTRAPPRFTLAHTEAKVKLIQLANDSYWERVRLEEALAQAEIARDPDEDEDYGEIPS